MTIGELTAVVVTRGDVELGPILDTLDGFGKLIVWDNSDRMPDSAVYGRYRALARVGSGAVYVQDDDVILPPESLAALAAGYVPGKIVANVPDRFRPHYPDSCLLGFGAVFDPILPALAFQRFARFHHEPGVLTGGAALVVQEPTFLRTCDVVFTALTDYVLYDLPYEEREFATASNRMYRQADHVGERARMLERARAARAAETPRTGDGVVPDPER